MSPGPGPSDENDTPISDAEIDARIAELDLVAEFIEAGETWSEAAPDGAVMTMDADKYRAALADLAADTHATPEPINESNVSVSNERFARRAEDPGEKQ